MDALSKIIYLLDEPVAGPAAIPMYFVNKLISQNNIRVVSGGQGVDELFGGYIPFYTLAAKNLMSLVKNGRSVPLGELFNIPYYLKRGGSFRRFSNRVQPAKLSLFSDVNMAKEPVNRYYKVQKELGPGILPFEQSMLISIKYYLPALLAVEDRMSMAWSIESRVPFLDYRLVEYSLTIPSYYKVKHSMLKAVFRSSMKGVVPDLILENKVKRGYPTPISVWSKKPMADFYKNVLCRDNEHLSQFINVDNVQKMLADHLSGKQDYTTQLWYALCTKLWLKNNF
jgi:asparagine synthase (glutamine-hydrolysing)